MKLKELIRTRRPWPYPKNTKEKVEVAATGVLVCLIVLVGIAAVYRYQQAKVLSAADLRQTAASLRSFAGAARRSLGAGKDGQLVGGFQKAHLTQLYQEVRSLNTEVSAHASQATVRRQARELAMRSGRLLRLLERESDPSGKQSDVPGAARDASTLETQFARLEGEL